MIGKPEAAHMVDVLMPASDPELLDRLVNGLPVQYLYVTPSVDAAQAKVDAVVRFIGSQEEILEVQRRSEAARR